MRSILPQACKLLALALVLGACTDDEPPLPPRPAHAQPRPKSAPAPAEIVPVDADELRARIRTSAARGALVNVWASWCGSCREEVPMLLGMQKALARDGIALLFVSADEASALPAARDRMRAWGGPLPTLSVRGSLGAFKRALQPDWRGAIPATFLFDASGKLHHFWEGPALEEELTPIVQRFLSGENVDGETHLTGPAPAH